MVSKNGRITIINRTEERVPRQWLELRLNKAFVELKKKRCHNSALLPCANGTELTLVFVNETEIKALNSRFRKKNKVTDVLSFTGDRTIVLGEIILCLPQARKQAVEHGFTLREEILYLSIHGVLHLLGYDHEEVDYKSDEMFQLQDDIFAKLIAP